MKFISFYQITITINAAATKITRRNTMHKYTRYILGNPSQTREKNPAKSFAIFFTSDNHLEFFSLASWRRPSTFLAPVPSWNHKPFINGFHSGL
jgi:hypothetical protein